MNPVVLVVTCGQPRKNSQTVMNDATLRRILTKKINEATGDIRIKQLCSQIEEEYNIDLSSKIPTIRDMAQSILDAPDSDPTQIPEEEEIAPDEFIYDWSQPILSEENHADLSEAEKSFASVSEQNSTALSDEAPDTTVTSIEQVDEELPEDEAVPDTQEIQSLDDEAVPDTQEAPLPEDEAVPETQLVQSSNDEIVPETQEIHSPVDQEEPQSRKQRKKKARTPEPIEEEEPPKKKKRTESQVTTCAHNNTFTIQAHTSSLQLSFNDEQKVFNKIPKIKGFESLRQGPRTIELTICCTCGTALENDKPIKVETRTLRSLLQEEKEQERSVDFNTRYIKEQVERTFEPAEKTSKRKTGYALRKRK
jgi:hypothetical protein